MATCNHTYTRFDIVTGGNEWEDFTDHYRKCSECNHTQKKIYVKREGEPEYQLFPEWQDTEPFELEIPLPPVPTYNPKAIEGLEWSNVRDRFYR